LTQVRKTRRRGALLAATTCALLTLSGTVASGGANAAGARPAEQGWSVDLDALTADDTGVRHDDGALRLDAPAASDGTTSGAVEASGQLVAAPVTLDSPAGAVAADVDATTPAGTSVLVDVRGRLADQGPDAWTEWVPAGSALPAPSDTVQARVTLVGERGAGPVVRHVTLTPQTPRSRAQQELEAAPPPGSLALVAARGRLAARGPQAWPEGVPAGPALPAPSDTVRARATRGGERGAGPVVRHVTLTPQTPRSRAQQELEAAPAS